MNAQFVSAKSTRHPDGSISLNAPDVGYWREGPPPGRILQPGDPIGFIERLGHIYAINVPEGVSGVVTQKMNSPSSTEPERPAYARVPVGYGAELLLLSPIEPSEGQRVFDNQTHPSGQQDQSSKATTDMYHLRAPLGGRYYGRPSPEQAPFVAVGDTIEEGQTVALIEVMKTFNRVLYEGASQGLPSPARVRTLLLNEDEDVLRGQPIIEVEPIS